VTNKNLEGCGSPDMTATHQITLKGLLNLTDNNKEPHSVAFIRASKLGDNNKDLIQYSIASKLTDSTQDHPHYRSRVLWMYQPTQKISGQWSEGVNWEVEV